MLVEDSDILQAALARGLKRWMVQVAPNGRFARALLNTVHPPFDVVVCDVSLPDLPGIRLYQQVSSRMPIYQQRFLFITGGTLTPEQTSFLRQTRQPVLYKPFKLDALRATIGSLESSA
ncbi:MAG: response regulator [Myxococcota bacterium]